jgi:hypothetical protein
MPGGTMLLNPMRHFAILLETSQSQPVLVFIATFETANSHLSSGPV